MINETTTDLRLPWIYRSATMDWCFDVHDARGLPVMHAGPHTTEGPSEPECAAFIVKAVNNHDALVAMVDRLARCLAEGGQHTGDVLAADNLIEPLI